MALAINPTLSVDPALSRPLPSSPHTPTCQTPCPLSPAQAMQPPHLCTCPLLHRAGVGGGLSFLPHPSSQFLPISGNSSKVHSCIKPSSPRVSVRLGGIPPTELCKDTHLVLTPLEAGNLRPSERPSPEPRIGCGWVSPWYHG